METASVLEVWTRLG